MVAVGRKNWMFAGSDAGGQRAAIIYSLVASCKSCQIDLFAYLRDVIGRVSTHPAKQIAALTPRGWRESSQNPITGPQALSSSAKSAASTSSSPSNSAGQHSVLP